MKKLILTTGLIVLCFPASNPMSFFGFGSAASTQPTVSTASCASGPTKENAAATTSTTIAVARHSTVDTKAARDTTDKGEIQERKEPTLNKIGTFYRILGSDDSITALASFNNGELIAVGSSQGTITFWDTKELFGKEAEQTTEALHDEKLPTCKAALLTLDADKEPICVTCLTAVNDTILAAGLANGEIWLIDITTVACIKKLITTFGAENPTIFGMAMLSDTYLAVGLATQSAEWIETWNLQKIKRADRIAADLRWGYDAVELSSTKLKNFKRSNIEQYPSRSLTVAPDHSLLVGGSDGVLRTWHLTTNKQTLLPQKDKSIAAIAQPTANAIECLAVLPTGYAVVGTNDKELGLINLTTKKWTLLTEGLRTSLTRLCVLDNKQLVASDADSTLWLYRIAI